jgi:predicted MFS family arabinose efflux permease
MPSVNETKIRFSRRESSILGLMFLVHFCLIVDFMVVMPQGPQLMRFFGATAAEFSLLVSTYTLGAGLLSLLSALFIDRFDRKLSLLVSFAGFAVGNVACALADSFHALVAARAITGAFAGVVGAVIFAIVSDSIDIARRASALGIVMSSFALASIVGVPLCLFASNHLGWHAPFYLLAGACTLSCGVLMNFLPRIDEHLTEVHGGLRETLGMFRELVGHPSRALALLFMTFLILGHFSLNPFLFPSVISNSETPEAKLPVIYLIGGLASMLASIAFGRAADRFGKKAIFGTALVASLLPIYWVTHLAPMGILPVTLVVTSFFVLMGGRLTPAMALVSATALPKNRGSFLSLIGSVQQLAAALAAFIAGSLVTRTGSGKLIGFGRVGIMAAAFSLVALALSRRIAPLEGENP